MGKIKNVSGGELALYAKSIFGQKFYKVFADNEEATVPDIILTTSKELIGAISRGDFTVTEGSEAQMDSGIKGSVAVFSALPATADEGDIYIVNNDEGGNPNGLYMYESDAWVLKTEISLQSATEVANDTTLPGANLGAALDTQKTTVDANAAHVAGDGSDHANVALNDTHRASDGTDHANVVLNDTHRASDGTDHANVVLNDTHRASDGTDHANVVLNDTHRASDGTDHANVVLNDTHRASDGTDHANVVLADTHRTGDGSDHADVATNSAHVAGDGSDHANVALNDAHRASTSNPHSVTAAQGSYTAGNAADWTGGAPTDIKTALDRIAAALGPIA